MFAVAVAVAVCIRAIDRRSPAAVRHLPLGDHTPPLCPAYGTLKPAASVLLLRLLSLNSSVELIGRRIDSSTRLGRCELLYTMTEQATISLGQILASKYYPQTASRYQEFGTTEFVHETSG